MAAAAERAQAPLRIVTVATFVPAFALCIAHGVKSGSPVPAVGLVPLAFSSGSSVLLLLLARQRRERQKRRQKQKAIYYPQSSSSQQQQQQLQQDNNGGTAEAQQQTLHQQEIINGDRGVVADREEEEDDTIDPPRAILTFFADTVLAAAIMVVLVFTWIRTTGNSAELAMLAAYATIPLLVNFFIHVYLAVREFSRGLAIPALIQYVAWQIVPGDCPDCGRYLRPESAPALPWFAPTSTFDVDPGRRSFRSYFKMPAALSSAAFWRKGEEEGGEGEGETGGRAPREWKMPKWRRKTSSGMSFPSFLPPWFRGQQQRYATLEDEEGAAPHHDTGAVVAAAAAEVEAGGDDGAIEEVGGTSAMGPYRDDPEAEEAGAAADEPSLLMTTEDTLGETLQEPEEVTVIGKKKKRSRGGHGSPGGWDS